MKFTYKKVKNRIRYVTINCKDNFEYENLVKFLTYKENMRKMNYRTGQLMWVTEDRFSGISKNDDNLQVKVKYGSSKVVESWLKSLDYEYTTENKPEICGIKPLERWLTQFSNHPKPEYGEIQKTTARLIENVDYGIISIMTGGGKTEVMLSVIDSYLQDYTGNAMIITYSSKVIDEIKLRAKKYGIESERLKFIQPNGFMKRKEASSKEFINFCKNTELLIADEAHHFTAKSWQDLFNLILPKFMYAFTGSADVKNGKELNYKALEMNRISSQASELMAYCGEMIIHKELQVPIRVYHVYKSFTNIEMYEDYIESNPDDLNKLIQFTLQDPRLASTIAEIVQKVIPSDSMVFIPEISLIETGVKLSDQLNRLGIPTVYYSGSYVNSPVGKIKITLEELKEMARQRHFKILISNTVGVEGIDIPNLSSIIPLTGVSFKSVIQPIGRSARSNLVHCVFIWDETNPLYMRQNKDRYRIVRKLNVVSENKISL